MMIAKVNKKKKFFAASKHNDFGGWQVENMMVDTGCSSVLLPLRENEVLQIFEKFKPTEYRFDINESIHAAHTLKVTKRMGRIDARLCADVLKETIALPFLRFHLCRSDLELLTSHPALTSEQHAMIATALPSANTKRRAYGIIGQSILFDPHVLFQLYVTAVLVDPTRFALSSWPALLAYEDVCARLPENVDELGDDHDGDDGEAYIPDDCDERD